MRWDVNVVISLFKSGDPEQPKNYRSITLISVFEKIFMGIMVRRLNRHMESKNLHDPGQAGFCPGEEAISQFITLAEIVRRRYNAKMPTYAVFIDFQKAYDKVPLALVLSVLRKYGFADKYVRIIKAVYKKTKIAVRAGGTVSDPYEMWRGLRQGCPLSPILFIIFISHLLEFLHPAGGVGTPLEWENRISAGNCRGLLYADDIVAFEKDLHSVQELIQQLSEWCMSWWMEIGHSKSGVMLWTDDDLLLRHFHNATFLTAFDEISQVDSYKYLGITVDETLPYSGITLGGARKNKESYVRLLVKKGNKTLHRLRPVFINDLCPLPIKTMLIRMFLTPTMLYGAEWLGFQQLSSFPLQRVINTAAHWAVGLRGTSNITDSKMLVFELSLPYIGEDLAAARTRLYLKSYRGQSGTWLSKLAKTKSAGGRESSWVFTSRKQITSISNKRYKYSKPDPDPSKPETYAPMRDWAMRGQAAENHMRASAFRSPQLQSIKGLLSGLDDLVTWSEESLSVTAIRMAEYSFDSAYEDFLQRQAMNPGTHQQTRRESELIRVVRECVRERSFAANKSHTFLKWYDVFSFGTTRGVIRNMITNPHLWKVLQILVAIRIRTFPNVRKRWLQAAFVGCAPHESVCTLCPLCEQEVDDGWEWAHLLMLCGCEEVKREQSRLTDSINIIRNELQLSGVPDPSIELTDKTEVGISWAVIAVYLVGGAVNNYFGCSYNFGYGHTDILPIGLNHFGYVPVAEFFQIVAPWFYSRLRVKPDHVDELLI
jgi:Reverse transcriptase (RNA-dependent DNA polymerase)